MRSLSRVAGHTFHMGSGFQSGGEPFPHTDAPGTVVMTCGVRSPFKLPLYRRNACPDGARSAFLEVHGSGEQALDKEQESKTHHGALQRLRADAPRMECQGQDRDRTVMS